MSLVCIASVCDPSVRQADISTMETCTTKISLNVNHLLCEATYFRSFSSEITYRSGNGDSGIVDGMWGIYSKLLPKLEGHDLTCD